MRKLLLITALLLAATALTRAQLYTGLEGLMHTPTAEMFARGSGRVGMSYLDRDFVATRFGQECHAYSVAYTPLDWAEASFTGIVRKTGNTVYQDRMMSFKLRPLEEGKWWPAIVLGSNDPLTTVHTSSDQDNNGHNANVFLAVSKHFFAKGQLGVHAGARYYIKKSNRKWNGIFAGVSYRPAPWARVMAEWDGNEVNVGADVKLFKFLHLQGMTMLRGTKPEDWSNFCLGITFEINHL